jgi:hypothetical protein
MQPPFVNHKCAALWFLVLVSCWPVAGQDATRIPLRIDRETPVAGLQGRGIINPVKCDTAGNIYVRFDQPRAFTAPIVKITPEGEKKAVFSLESAGEWDAGEIYDFTVHQDGGLYLLAARRGKGRHIEQAILSFNEEGKFRFAIPVKAQLTSVDQLAVFPSGEFLITGWNEIENPEAAGNRADAGKPREVEARTMVLSQNGDVVREVSLIGDLEQPTPSHASRSKRLRIQEAAISLGRSAPGDNGEIFLKFRTATPEVYTILPKATVVRRIDVRPPGEESQALNIWYAAGTGLVMQFADKGPRGSFNTALSVISVVNPQTGERLYEYQATGEIGGVFACYAPRGLLFLWTDKDGRLILRRTVPS